MTPLHPTPSVPEDRLDTTELRRLMGQFATGVAVVTTRDHDGGTYGFAANAFTSLSLHPPLVLVCAARTSQTRPVLIGAGGFAVNILAHEQADICRAFATKAGADKFAGIETHTSPLGYPVLANSLAYVDCCLQSILPGGDHAILIGAVKGGERHDGTPLLFWAGQFAELNEIE